MTARDMTGLYAFFSARKWSTFLHILGAISLLNYTVNLEKINPLEKIQKIQWRRRPEIADVCPLSWSNVS